MLKNIEERTLLKSLKLFRFGSVKNLCKRHSKAIFQHVLAFHARNNYFPFIQVRTFTATRKEAGPFCGSFLRKGEVFAFVGLRQNGFDVISSR